MEQILTAKDLDYLKRVTPVTGRGLPVLLGAQATRRAGQGSDFFQLRPYVVGDDPRKIAWRLGMRHQQWLVRDQVHEGPMKWRLWLDKTKSMELPERKNASNQLTQAIGWVWARNRNEIAIKETWAWAESPLIIVSDFVWEDKQWEELLRIKRQQRVLAVHLVYPYEIKWEHQHERVQDSETQEKLRIASDDVAVQEKQTAYWARAQEYLRGIPTSTWCLGKDDLTCVEGVLWN